MTLDSLHKVMTGESTLDKEMQIGEISHRKDGDWKKVAPGKWAPVKAAGGAQATGEKKSFTGSGNMAGHKWEAEKVGDKYISTHTWPDGRTDKTDITKEEYDTMKTNTPAEKQKTEKQSSAFVDTDEEFTSSLKEKDAGQLEGMVRGGEELLKNPWWGDKQTIETIKRRTELVRNELKSRQQPAEKKPEPKANPYKADQDNFMRLLQKVEGKEYADPSKVKIYRTDKGNWNVYYDGHRLGIYDKSEIDTEAAEELGWWERPAPNFEESKPEPKAEGGKRQLKRRADGTIIYETPDDVIYDMVENYNELDRGDLQGVIEAAAMSHGWDENEILEEVDRQAAEKYDLNVDAAPGIAKKAVELAQRDYTDVPGRVLTADTKVRLSKIKR